MSRQTHTHSLIKRTSQPATKNLGLDEKKGEKRQSINEDHLFASVNSYNDEVSRLRPVIRELHSIQIANYIHIVMSQNISKNKFTGNFCSTELLKYEVNLKLNCSNIFCTSKQKQRTSHSIATKTEHQKIAK